MLSFLKTIRLNTEKIQEKCKEIQKHKLKKI